VNLLRQEADWSELRREADKVRQKYLGVRPASTLCDIYTVTYFLGHALRSRFPKVQIMVGEYGGQMHHWLEIPERGIYVDAAADAIEGEPPVHVGFTFEDAFVKSYAKGRESRFRFDEPRDDPKYVYAPEGPTSTYRD